MRPWSSPDTSLEHNYHLRPQSIPFRSRLSTTSSVFDLRRPSDAASLALLPYRYNTFESVEPFCEWSLFVHASSRSHHHSHPADVSFFVQSYVGTLTSDLLWSWSSACLSRLLLILTNLDKTLFFKGFHVFNKSETLTIYKTKKVLYDAKSFLVNSIDIMIRGIYL